MLDEIESIKDKRKIIYEIYQQELKDIVKLQKQNENTTLNYSYFPVIFKDTKEREKVQKALNDSNIYPRRYFNPSLDTLNYIEPKQYMPKSRDVSNKILCLPLYTELLEVEQKKILGIIKDIIKRISNKSI
jgi:dTDP-4-amino-4,6-dideoxygalactose transaminase